MDKQNQIIKEIFNNTARQLISSPAELYQFLMQNRYLYELPITTIIEIYGQNPTATKVKTFDEWSELGGAVISGQKGIQTLIEPNNPYSKRTTYFDMTQVAHKELNVESLMLTENQVFKFLELEKFDILFPNDTAERDFWRYIKDKAETGLANFAGLSEAEKAVVPFIAEFSLNTELNISTEADDLRKAGNIQAKFKDNPELRPLEVIKIANNLSKSILISIQKNLTTLEKVAELENDKQAQFQTEKALVLEWVTQYKGFKNDEQRKDMLYRFEQSHLEVKHDRQDGVFLDSGGTVLFSDEGLIPKVLSEPSLLPDGFEPSFAPDNLRVYVDFALNGPESTLEERQANSDKFLITQVKQRQNAKYGEDTPVVNDVLENLTSVDEIWTIQDKIETAIDVANQVFNQDILATDVPEDIFTSAAVVEAETTHEVIDEYQLPESSTHDISDNLTVLIQYQAAHRFLKNQIERRVIFMENGALESDTPIAEIISLIDKDNTAEMISNPFDIHFSKKFDLKFGFGMDALIVHPGHLGLPDDFDLHEIVATINRQKNLALTIDKTKDEQLAAIEVETVAPDSNLGEISLFDDIVELTAVEPEENPLAYNPIDIQDILSQEGDLIYTNGQFQNSIQVEDSVLKLHIWRLSQVEDSFENVPVAPWAVEVIEDSISQGYLAYGEHWGKEFDIEAELFDRQDGYTYTFDNLYTLEEVQQFISEVEEKDTSDSIEGFSVSDNFVKGEAFVEALKKESPGLSYYDEYISTPDFPSVYLDDMTALDFDNDFDQRKSDAVKLTFEEYQKFYEQGLPLAVINGDEPLNYQGFSVGSGDTFPQTFGGFSETFYFALDDWEELETEKNPQILLDEQVVSSGKFYIQLDGADNGSYYMDEIRMGDVLISTSSTNILTNAMAFESYEAALGYIDVRDDDAQFKAANIVDEAGNIVQGIEKEISSLSTEAVSEISEPYKSLNNMLAISEYQKEMLDLNESEQLFVKNTVKNYLDDEAYNAFGKNSFSELAHDEQGGIVNAYAEQIDEIAKEKSIVLDEPVEPKIQEQPKEIKATTLAAAKGINVVNMDSDGQEISHDPTNDGHFQSDRPTEPPKAFSFPENLADFYPKTPTEKVTANLEAIRLVKSLEKENRQATSQEQAILAQYVGWGGLANTFFDDNLKRYEGQREALKAIVSSKEYAAMRRSSLTAYYTDPAMGTGNFFSAMPENLLSNSDLYGVELDGITGAIAKQLHPEADIKIQGFETTEFNDDAFDVVIGNVPFADFSITDDRYDKPYVIHDYFFKKSLDLVRDGGIVAFITSTGTMDKRNSTFRQEISTEAGFISGVRLPNNAFKAIAGTDVSTDILFFQKGNQGYSELVGNWHETTSVPDVNHDGEYLEGVSANRYFTDIEHVAGHYDVKNFHGKTLTVNPTPAVELPHLINTILSEQISPSPTFNSDEIKIKDFSETYNPTYMHRQAVRENDEKNQAIDKLNAHKENIVWLFEESAVDLAAVAETPSVSKQSYLDVSIPETVRDLAPQTHMIHDGKIYFNDSIDGIVEKNEAWFRAGYIQKRNKDDELVFEKNGKPAMWWSRGKWSQTVLPRLTAMVEISSVVQEIIQYQHDSPDKGQDDTAFQVLLDKLNTSYDAFTTNKKLKGKYGNFLNRKENAQLFEEDLNYYSVLAIESDYRDDKGDLTYRKSDFFHKKTIASRKEIVVSNPVDALNASINRYGTINFEYMSELLPLSKEDYIAELDSSIYLNPVTEKYEQADDYLSGNIHTKLMALEELKATDKIDEAVYLKNKTALDKVMPEPLSITEIDFKIGSRFIPTEVYQQFLAEKILGLNYTHPDGVGNGGSRRMQVAYNQTLSKYVISEPSLFNKDYVSQGLYNDLIIEGETRRHNPVHLFNDMLNLRKTTVNYYDSSGRKQTNAALTAVAENKQKLLALEFNEFVMDNEVIRQEITDIYNRDHNSTVVRTYDGSHFTFDGLTTDIELRPHQKDAVSRVVQSQRGLFAHVVGSGKTLSMIASGMKLKELGLAHKPLYVVPKSILKQFGKDMKQAYSDRNIISPSPRDFIKERRRKLIARIGAGDYDAVILSHEQFGKIPLAKEREDDYLSQELDSIKTAIFKAKEEQGKKVHPLSKWRHLKNDLKINWRVYRHVKTTVSFLKIWGLIFSLSMKHTTLRICLIRLSWQMLRV
ncbi:hypothetical protein RyT2_13980 [Pseudolactococcus yaeyamensis]